MNLLSTAIIFLIFVSRIINCALLGVNPIFKSIFDGDIDKVEECIKVRKNVNVTDRHGNYPISLAARLNNLNIVLTLLEAKANYLLRDAANKNALNYAIERENGLLISAMMQRGAQIPQCLHDKVQNIFFYTVNMSAYDLNVPDQYGNTPFYYLIGLENEQRLKCLIENYKKYMIFSFTNNKLETALTLAHKFNKFLLVKVIEQYILQIRCILRESYEPALQPLLEIILDYTFGERILRCNYCSDYPCVQGCDKCETYYCSSECHKKDWSRHKLKCRGNNKKNFGKTCT